MAIRRFVGGIVLSLVINAATAAEPPATVVIGTPPQPGWAQLSPERQVILAPLSKDWDSMENIRKKKWLGIADRYPAMKPDEKQRMQDRMREWASLSPAERNKVRDTYKDFNQLPNEQKQVVKQKWEAYSNLSPEERQRIRETSRSSKLLAPGAPSGAATPTVAAESAGNTPSAPGALPQ